MLYKAVDMMRAVLLVCALIVSVLAEYSKQEIHKAVTKKVVHKTDGYKGEKVHVEEKKSVQIYHGKYGGS